MNADKAVTANFKYVPPLMIDVVPPEYFDSFQQAYTFAKSNSLTGMTIKARTHTFIENLQQSDPLNVIIKGGYDASYTTQTGYTLLQGLITIRSGKLTTEFLTVK